MTDPLCPYCQGPAKLTTGQELYRHRQDLRKALFWNCRACRAYVGCHRGTTKPLGTLANLELRKARGRAHEAFDPIWKGGAMSRTQAYEWLSKRLDLPSCHIAQMDLSQCELVVRVSEEIAATVVGRTK
jgi:hypothetical protein